MIELTVLDHLSEQLTVPVYMELPSGAPDRFVVLRKADSGRENFIYSAMFTFRSYGESLLEAARLNEQVKAAVDRISELDAVASARLNGDYPFPDTSIKRHCYQAVYDITHY
ncbi:MAG: hypothetical protein IJD21_03030 [Oscillospiraceae bacterium]|nr:hypothetical protein [Oscillospiraceae bacterium]